MSRKNFDEAVRLIKNNEGVVDMIGPLAENIISDAEAELGVSFPPMFREYLLRFGQLQIGSQEIYGLMGEGLPGGAIPDFLWLTKDLRSSATLPLSYLPLADVGDGRLYVLDLSQLDEAAEPPVLLVFPSKEIPPDSVERVFDDFGDFLLDQVTLGIS